MLIPVANKYIPKERIVSIGKSSHIVFPFIKFTNSLRISSKFPFVKKRYSWSLIEWRKLWCIEVTLDTGKTLRQWYNHEGPGGYCSSVNCARGFSEFTNYFN